LGTKKRGKEGLKYRQKFNRLTSSGDQKGSRGAGGSKIGVYRETWASSYGNCNMLRRKKNFKTVNAREATG